MAKLTEILDSEKRRTEPQHFRQIHLWSDGSFYRAYEWSAWLFVILLKFFGGKGGNKHLHRQIIFYV